MLKKIALIVVIPAMVFSTRIWFDFSSPLTAYILGRFNNGDGVGLSLGFESDRIPAFELSYFDISGKKYVSLKPLIFEGRIERIRQFDLYMLLNAGMDLSFPNLGGGIYLVTGIAGNYETSGEKGVFLKVAFEIGIRLNVFGEDFSPYYINFMGPLVMRPALIVGGKF